MAGGLLQQSTAGGSPHWRGVVVAGVESASVRGGLIVRLPGSAAVPDHIPSNFLGDNSHGIKTATFSASTCAFTTTMRVLEVSAMNAISTYVTQYSHRCVPH